MAAGWPTKVTYANGDVYSASDVNDTNGTLNYIDPTSATNNQVLTRDSAAGGKVKWANSPANTLTATGDLYYASAANTPARLAIGSTDQILVVAGGVPTWATGGGGMTLISSSSPTGTNTLTFSSIPSSYQNLQLFFNGVRSTTGDELRMRVNGVSAANTYAFQKMSNAGNSFSQTETSMTLGDTAGGTNSRSGSAIFYNYANATAFGKQMAYWSNRIIIGTGAGLFDFGTGVAMGTSASGYQGVAAISSITVFQTNNFQAGTFSLYGVK